MNQRERPFWNKFLISPVPLFYNGKLPVYLPFVRKNEVANTFFMLYENIHSRKRRRKWEFGLGIFQWYLNAGQENDPALNTPSTWARERAWKEATAAKFIILLLFSLYMYICFNNYIHFAIWNSANSLYFIKEGTTHCWDVCCHKQQHSVIWTPLFLITLMAVIIQLKPVLIADSQQGKAKGTPRAGENKLSRSFITMAFKGQALSHSFSPLPKTLWFMEAQSQNGKIQTG